MPVWWWFYGESSYQEQLGSEPVISGSWFGRSGIAAAGAGTLGRSGVAAAGAGDMGRSGIAAAGAGDMGRELPGSVQIGSW
mgnify:FL=1